MQHSVSLGNRRKAFGADVNRDHDPQRGHERDRMKRHFTRKDRQQPGEPLQATPEPAAPRLLAATLWVLALVVVLVLIMMWVF